MYGKEIEEEEQKLDEDFYQWQANKKLDKAYRNAKTWYKNGKPKIEKVKKKPIEKKVQVQRDKYKYVPKKNKVFTYTTLKDFDFMKYYAIVEYWALLHYDLTREELMMLFYAYSESYFTKDVFNEFGDVITKKKNSIDSFIERGIVEEIKRVDKYGTPIKINKIYKVSFKWKNIVKAIYDRIVLKYKISDTVKHNKLFRKIKSTKEDRKYKDLVIKMNLKSKEIREGKSIKHNKDDLMQIKESDNQIKSKVKKEEGL